MRSSFLIRLLSLIIDLIIALALGLVMSHSIGYFFATRAEVMLLIGHPQSIWKGPVPLILGVIGPLTYVLPLAVLVVMLAEPLFDTSPGKLILKLKIAGLNGDRPSVRNLWLRHLVKTSPLWLMNLGLITGMWHIAVMAVLVFAVLVAGFFLSLGLERLAWHDKISRTSVFLR